MRSPVVRAAAVVVVFVFASLPTLARVHDRLSTHDDVGSFRLSKNLERPHEKIGAATLASSTVALVCPEQSPCADCVAAPAPTLADPFVASLFSRAPPAC